MGYLTNSDGREVGTVDSPLVVLAQASADFGSVGNLSPSAGDSFTFSNKAGFSTVGVHVVVPAGGTVQFQASFDGRNWEPITLRGINSDILVQSTSDDGDYIGSIAGSRSFRVAVTAAGSSAGTVVGRCSRDAAAIETIEFGAPPHKIGYNPVHRNRDYTTAQTGAALWTPSSGKRFVLTDIVIFASGTTDATLTVFDETDALGNRIFRSFVDVTNNKQFAFSHGFKMPFVSDAADNVLRVTTDADLVFHIGAHGYEI